MNSQELNGSDALHQAYTSLREAKLTILNKQVRVRRSRSLPLRLEILDELFPAPSRKPTPACAEVRDGSFSNGHAPFRSEDG